MATDALQTIGLSASLLRVNGEKETGDELDGVYDAVAEYIAANDELIAAKESLKMFSGFSKQQADEAIRRVWAAEDRHAMAHARMKGEAK